MTLVKLQLDLLLKMNISLNGYEWVKSVAKRLLKILFWQKTWWAKYADQYN